MWSHDIGDDGVDAVQRLPRKIVFAGRTFTSAADFNTQMQQWLTGANTRIHRTTRKKPAEELLIDRQSMAPLPPIAPGTGTSITTRLGRDHYVQIAGSVYSVNP
jgi:hypothetical protein